MKHRYAKLAIVLAGAGLALAAQAHRAWILPAATVLSSEDPWVSFDAAVSNDIFHPDFHALGLEDIKAAGPGGGEVPLQNPHTGKHRSNFDLNLGQPGTYKVYSASSGLSATWESEDGERHRWPGRGERPQPGEFARAVPDDAKNLKVTQRSRRLETFVTAGAPTEAALAPTNVGLEMVPLTHPNDLYAGETARFRFLIDGQPAAGTQVSVLPGGMRYRDSQEEIKLTTDEQGAIAIDWPRAGMYFLEADYSDDKAQSPATSRSGSYSATFEVLPL